MEIFTGVQFLLSQNPSCQFLLRSKSISTVLQPQVFSSWSIHFQSQVLRVLWNLVRQTKETHYFFLANNLSVCEKSIADTCHYPSQVSSLYECCSRKSECDNMKTLSPTSFPFMWCNFLVYVRIWDIWNMANEKWGNFCHLFKFHFCMIHWS